MAAGGDTSVLGLYFGGYIRFVSLLQQSNIPATDEEQALLHHLAGNNSKVKLFRNRFASTPVLVGGYWRLALSSLIQSIHRSSWNIFYGMSLPTYGTLTWAISGWR